jgi:ribosomal-protein-alanine N-acetyltransferase
MTNLVPVTPENQDSLLNGILEIETLSFSSPWSSGAFMQEINNPISHLWTLLANGSLAGYICFWMFDTEIELINIAIHPLWRGTGCGKRLIEKMIETGVSKGIHQIWLEVRVSNETAQRLYYGLGFEAVGRRRRYYTDTREDAIIMTLHLPGNERHRRISN